MKLVCAGVLFLSVAWLSSADGASPDWAFTPSKAGRALHEGGWMVEHQLGQVNASPEFSFPLQLIYRNNREQQGLFGSQWWCPQLESTVLPRGRGVVVWTMPSGGVVGLFEDPKRAGEYRSPDGEWRARVSPSLAIISNADGWQYSYSRGRLDSVTSPTGRVLELAWTGGAFQAMQLRDSVSGATLPLLRTAYGENKRLAVLENSGQTHKFGYIEDAGGDYLSNWTPPIGRPASFVYDAESKVLKRASHKRGKDPADVVDFKVEFVRPYENNKPKNEANPRRNPANWWLVGDNQFDYAYARAPKDKEQWLSEQITLTGRNGVKQEIGFAANRGILTAKPDGAPERKTYYYRAPGQRHDGKLRRVEEDEKLLVEFRYDRRTGLMTEQHDANGLITFFDYDPNWRPAKREVWEPKPIRVRRGTRRATEVVGEFTYDDHGRLVAAKDIAGQTTRYAYNARGEVTAVTDPEGATTAFTFDNFGRRTSITRNGVKESVEYDDHGRIKATVAADGTRTELVLDKQGQVEAVSQNGKTTVSFSRDESGQVVGEKDALGRERKAERDARGNLLAEHAPNGSVTRYEYDESNCRIAQIDGKGNKITFAHDPMGRLIKQVNPLGETLTWTYDKSGRLIERTNGEQTIHHTYDESGRLTRLDYGKGQVIDYEHDKEGRVIRASSPEATFEYAHDKLGRVAATVMRQGDEEQMVRYDRNARGQRTALILSRLIDPVPSKGDIVGKEARYEVLQQAHYTYDNAGRLASITTDGFPAISYRYDGAGRVVQKLYGGDNPENASVIANIGYDARSRLARIEFSGKDVNPPLLLSYEWDAASQLTRRSWNNEAQRYEYDPGGQLLKVLNDKTGQTLEAYRYDSAGNMVEKTIDGQRTAMTYNAANQLVKAIHLPEDADTEGKSPEELEKTGREVLTYSYDKAGRMLGPKGQPTSTYGWLDKVTELTQPDGSKTTLTYWPDGQLAGRKTSGSPIHADSIQQVSFQSAPSADDSFLWDGLALLKRNDTVYIIESHPSGGVPVASHPVGRPDRITWHLNDLLGTTLATVDRGTTRFAKLTAFGQPLKLAASGSAASAAQPDATTQPTVPSPPSIPRTTIGQ